MALLLTLTGPSSSGKSTLEDQLRARGFRSLVSTTTRTPRAGEKGGESYFFVTRAEFEAASLHGDFIESNRFDDHFYGLSRDEFERAAAEGRPLVVVLDPNGVAAMKEYCASRGDTVLRLFIVAPLPLLLYRLIRRYLLEERFSLSRFLARLRVLLTEEAGWANKDWDIRISARTLRKSPLDIQKQLEAVASLRTPE